MTRPLLLLLISLALSSPASATISENHGYAQFGTLKHPARFTHFDWANGLLNKNGQPLRFEILRVNPSLERILQPYVENLASIGVDARLRTVDRAQYKQCLDQFDFDMILMTLDQNLSPGLEQWQYFHSSQAGVKGSKNYAGVASPVVDHLLETLPAVAPWTGSCSGNTS